MSSSSGSQQPSHHGRLTTMDASFLYFERESAPMHIGALCVIDGELDTDSYRAQIEHRLRKLPRFRERVVPPPLYVGHPTWETDPDFDLDNHLPVHDLEAPGDMAALRRLTNSLIEGQLNRTRPLWEIHIIRGLEGGRTALVTKVHHAMVDGVGGNAIMLALFDLEPHPPEKEIEDRYVPTERPSGVRRVGEAVWDNVRTQIDVWSSHMTRLTEIGQGAGLSALRRTASMVGDSMPELMLPPKRLPFNRRCTGGRDFAFTELSFTEVRAIRQAIGGTLNDVMLTGLAGALGRYARHHGQDTEQRNARIMVPVNVRPEGETANLGNLVSILPVRVPLDIEDPAMRLQSVRSSTRVLKEGRFAEGVNLMTNLASAVPAPFQAAFGAIAISPYPLFNLVCTNVPGPQIPLYAQGHRLDSYWPIVPVGFEMGVCCAIFSYNQKLFIGLNSDTGACSDIDVLRDFLDESFAELRALAGLDDDLATVLTLRRVPIRGRRSAGAARTTVAKTARKAAAKTTSKKASRKASRKTTATKAGAKKASRKAAPKKRSKNTSKKTAKKTAGKTTKKAASRKTTGGGKSSGTKKASR